jgi:hypothetical protein
VPCSWKVKITEKRIWKHHRQSTGINVNIKLCRIYVDGNALSISTVSRKAKKNRWWNGFYFLKWHLATRIVFPVKARNTKSNRKILGRLFFAVHFSPQTEIIQTFFSLESGEKYWLLISSLRPSTVAIHSRMISSQNPMVERSTQ